MDTIASTPTADLAPTLARLRAAQAAHVPDYAQRIDDLVRLRAAFKARLEEMNAAVSADFGHRSRHETLVSDGMMVLSEIDHLRRHLKAWMRPQRRRVDMLFLPARAQLRFQPLGVVGVISPWNYPVNLALMPLAVAIAAGNHVYLKPSEHTPRTSEFLRTLLADVFPADRVAVALGEGDVAAAFAALPFDHLLFTGSTAVGRKVLAAAAPNLTPVTLELGGKSPAIVADGYPLERAAARIVARFQHQGRRQQARLPGPFRIDGNKLGDAEPACTRIVEITAQSLVLLRIHDARIVRIVVEARIARLHLARERGDEGIALCARHEHVVRRDAGLAGVEPLARRDARGGAFERIAVGDDGG